jgi:membrane protease YdiL (CAAX protease family)
MPRVWAYLALTLAFTLGVQAPGALAARGVIDAPLEKLMGLLALGALGPTVVAVLFARKEPGGVRALFARLRIKPPGPHWYAIALGGFAALYVAGVAVYRVAGGELPWLWLPSRPEHIAAMVMFPIVEEIGWRGYALPRLMERYGFWRATWALGLVWSAWHTMMFLAVTGDPAVLAISFVNIVAGNVLFSWLFVRTNGSLLLAWLAHVGVHWNNPGRAPEETPLVVYTAAIAVGAVLVAVLDRARLAEPRTQPRQGS